MNREERIASSYLEDLQRGNVVFEPLGNSKLPDFALGTGIGVEVRRLNEHYFSGMNAEGLEQVDRRVWGALQEAVSRFDSDHSDRAFWVMVEFERPLAARGRRLRRLIERALAAFLDQTPSGNPPPYEVQISDALRLFLYPSSINTGNPYRLGGSSDEDSGGSVVGLYLDNLNHCIAEKSRKLSKVESAFDEWWLVLVDNMGFGLASPETESVSASVKTLGRFQRVVLLNYQGSQVLLDLAHRSKPL